MDQVADTNRNPLSAICVACEETHPISSGMIVYTCRHSDHHYCLDCLQMQFEGAADSTLPIPPMCCEQVMGLHLIVGRLSEETIKQYRLKLAEFMRLGQYCPNPQCSKWILEKFNPEVATPTQLPTTPDALERILADVRYEIVTRELYFSSTTAIDLARMRERAASRAYGSIDHLTSDMEAAVYRTYREFRPGTPEYRGGNHMGSAYRRKVREVTGTSPPDPDAPRQPPARSIFLCPHCLTTVCGKCQKLSHGSDPCDSKSEEEETEALKALNIKRCPLCKAMVEKTEGCNHMVCKCGADFCWRCGQPRYLCQGYCEQVANPGNPDTNDQALPDNEPERGEAGEQEDEEEDEEEDEDEDEEDDEDMDDDVDIANLVPQNVHRQIWSCQHQFGRYLFPTIFQGDARVPGLNFNLGDLNKMECVRCNGHVMTDEASAMCGFQCHQCQMIVCAICCEQYIVEGKGRTVWPSQASPAAQNP